MAENAPATSRKRRIEEDTFLTIADGASETNDYDKKIFYEFLKDQNKMESLSIAYDAVKEGHDRMNLCMLEVTESNARLSEGFSRASCATSKYKDNGAPVTVQLGSIFMDGLAVLKAFLDEEVPKIPVDNNECKALSKLLNFMYDDHSALFDLIRLKDSKVKKGKWALGLAQHLLSPLAVGGNYTIDSYADIAENQNTCTCPCKAGDRLVGKMGDTSFGCKNGWHGKSDILMDGVLSVECAVHADDTDDAYDADDKDDADRFSVTSSTEVKTSEKFTENDRKQLVAQTIVFSFLQHKNSKDRMKNFLVPGIGISCKNVKVYFYECEEDVLLETATLDLHAFYPELYLHTVLLLWLTLNYKIFCTGITNEMKNFKAGFFERVGDRLKMYRDDVIIPCHKNRDEEPSYTEDNEKWAQNQNRIKKGRLDVKLEVTKFTSLGITHQLDDNH